MSAPGLSPTVRSIVGAALAEDLGSRGDCTSDALFDAARTARARIRMKEDGVISGMSILGHLFSSIDPGVLIEYRAADGDRVASGATMCELSGPIRAILAGERTALNFLQRLGGIATATAAMVEKIAHTDAVLLDTRKTTPALRLLEKQAVVHGGGQNHRFGLFDMMLIKDTHVRASGGVRAALKKALPKANSEGIAVEIEVETIEQCDEALALKPRRIMLDNMSCEQMRRCVARRNESAPGVELEASGTITEKTIRQVAETGVDYISCGSITHSARSLDIHLIITE